MNKVEASVLPSGKALNWTNTFIGSVSDITILRKKWNFTDYAPGKQWRTRVYKLQAFFLIGYLIIGPF